MRRKGFCGVVELDGFPVFVGVRVVVCWYIWGMGLGRAVDNL